LFFGPSAPAEPPDPELDPTSLSSVIFFPAFFFRYL
jgi:hypothetical protein